MHKHYRDEAYREKQRQNTLAYFRSPEGQKTRKRLSKLRKWYWKNRREMMLAANKKAHAAGAAKSAARTLEETIEHRRASRYSDGMRGGRAASSNVRFKQGCHIYVISMRGFPGRYKVGLALNYKERFIRLANQMPSGALTLRAFGFVKKKPGDVELAAHREFGPADGEWIKGGFKKVCDFLRERCEFGSFIVLKAPR